MMPAVHMPGCRRRAVDECTCGLDDERARLGTKKKKKRTRPDATSHPSLPVAFRSKLYMERASDDRWAAHLKVDHDQKNPLLLGRIRRFVRVDLVHLSGGEVVREDVVGARVYRTRRGHHLRVFFRSSLPRLPAATILAMQAALGDDPRRREMNAARVAKNRPNWNCLWTMKYVNGKLVGREVFDKGLTVKVREIFGLEPRKKARGV